ncbi:peptide/nickel transport system permease protein [Brevibacterium sandarakinum]|uniref:Peptide/nickel transport system permease protein n=1 Tax=Brevibacterium sandarakinum TaxID=629680 RepID=A0A1H1Q8J0_BRESA|nr:ABC transporter permease subunit [Brevibacterium sandarakinum]SDS19730.1 peptide/nickel transport system permease protein [Brevibacterium sandarakinum]
MRGTLTRNTARRCAIIVGGMLVAVLAAGAGVFALAAASPANPLAHMISSWEFASAQARADLEAAYQSGGWLSAWWHWLVTAVTSGDLGYSRILHSPVAEIVTSRGLNTIAASLTAAAITVIVVGVVAIALARFPGLAQSLSASGLLAAWLAVPSFLIALIIVVIWGAQLPNPATSAPITLIPGVAITIALAWAAPLIAAARSAAAEVWSTPWARALIGRGFSRSARIRTVLPTVLGAVRSPALVYLPTIVVGEAAVEAVLAYPGLGNALVQAAAGADLPLLATVTSIAAGVTTGLVLLVRTATAGSRSGASHESEAARNAHRSAVAGGGRS